jgi:hypothetical protein
VVGRNFHRGLYGLQPAHRRQCLVPFENDAYRSDGQYQWNLKDAAWEFGRYSADFGLKGPYRLLVKIGSPQFFLQKGAEFMSAYYRPSTIETTEYGDGFGVVRITKFPEMDKTTECRIGGWIQRALEINGCKDVKVDITKSLTTFDAYTEFKITWST